jgi:glutamine amidotransferase
MILIIDYGMGNLRSVQKAFEQAESNVHISSSYSDIERADRLVLPGVGAFGDAVRNIDKLNLKEPIIEFIHKGKPFLGICLGLQLLFTDSAEKGSFRGFDIVKGSVLQFSDTLKVPQIGWNQISIAKETPIFQGIPSGTFFYFVHSFFVSPIDKNVTAGITSYGIDYTSAIAVDNMFGVQFHPEKSQRFGLQLIKNFCKI